MHIETIAIHAGHTPDPTTGAVAPPIVLSTTFERAPDGSFPHGNIYSRTENPNRHALEAGLAALEGGAMAAAFASGVAAIGAVMQAIGAGAHVIIPGDSYAGTKTLLREMAPVWSLEVTAVDMADLDALRAAIRPTTRLILVETPSNPLLKITDIAAVADIAHAAGALCAVDNTWATPVLQRPFDLGADVIIHATTKYFGGHSDVLGGAAICQFADAFSARIRTIQGVAGAVPSPFDCWLILRGAATLPLRIQAHAGNAAQVAAFLHEHPRVTAVYYPGLPDHPGHTIAARQMRMFGGMLSFQVSGGRDAAMRLAAHVQLFTRATSLGGVESLIEHRASIEGAASTTPDDLLRVSVGLEHPDDLIADLEQALAASR
jgi:cystathionine gamma-synthase